MCRRWAGDFGDSNNLFESKSIKPFVILGQKDEHVEMARNTWNLSYDILTDTTNKLANVLNDLKLADIDIVPSAWHPDKTNRPAVGFDPKHPEYDYPHGMTQPAVILLQKQSVEDSTFSSAKSLYSWGGKNHTPRPKPNDAVKHMAMVVDAYDAGNPIRIDSRPNEKGYSIGHALCCGKRRVLPCMIQ